MTPKDARRQAREAMWQVWEERMVDLRRERDVLAARVETLTAQLTDNRIDETNEPRCDVPDFGPAIAQYRGGPHDG